MRPHLPALVDSMVQGVLRHVPEYARPDDPVYTEVMRLAVAQGMGHFVQMIADPDASWQEVHQVFFDIGYGEAIEGRGWSTCRTRCGSRPGRRGGTCRGRPTGCGSPGSWRSR